MRRRTAVILALVFATVAATAAQSGRMTLLTVARNDATGTTTGGTANLFLEVRPGSGKIFIESYPLTKLDTQISTRFAKDVACKHVDIDCSRYNFYYTIRADSSIVGGPSAGAGAAALTAAVLRGEEFDESVTLTGTINSGGIIGPVAGIPEKVAAAQQAGLEKVVIPAWSSFTEQSFTNATNSSLEIDVVKARNLGEALYHFTGDRQERLTGDIDVPQEYTERMSAIATKLCNRTSVIVDDLPTTLSDNFTAKVDRARNRSRPYARASYCFGKNVELRQEQVESVDDAEGRVAEVRSALNGLEETVDATSLRTFADLETYMIVKERIVDARRSLEEMNGTAPSTVGYVIERYFSAVAWSDFFGMSGKRFRLDEQYMERACVQKVQEAQERIDYIKSITPRIDDLEDDLEVAKQYKRSGEFAPCVFKTSKVKAEADMFLLAMTTEESRIPEVVDAKLDATKQVMLQQQRSGIFPILGYSYYDYAESLKSEDPSSALLFSEYALEVSNLDLYFPEEESVAFRLPELDRRDGIVFVSGVLVGLAFVGLKPKKTR